jgi:hypothetical protein
VLKEHNYSGGEGTKDNKGFAASVDSLSAKFLLVAKCRTSSVTTDLKR